MIGQSGQISWGPHFLDSLLFSHPPARSPLSEIEAQRANLSLCALVF